MSVYREPGDQAEETRDDLGEMAREGQLRRAAHRARQEEAAALAASDEQTKRDKELQAKDAAARWRGVQRLSPFFGKLVSISFWGCALSFFAVCGSGGIAIEEGTATPFLVSLAAGSVVVPVLVLAVLFKRRALYEEEERWAKERGVTGHLLAVGHTVRATSELDLVVDLERAPSPDQARLLDDAIAAVSPRSSVETKKRRVVVHSGELPEKDLGAWCRDVVERFLPKLEDHGVRRAVMRAKDDGIVLPDPD